MQDNQEEQALLLGDAAQKLLADTSFNEVVNTLVEGSFQQFVNSKPESTQDRERAYSAYRGLTDIVATLQQRVAVRDQILAKRDNNEEE